MNEQKKLTIQMTIFFIIIVTLFTVIVLKEKQSTILLPKVEQKIDNYIDENYNSQELTKGKITINNDTYKIKITNKKNKNHCFYITYSNKKITDTYKEDYLEGKTLIKHLNNVIEKSIYEKTNKQYTIKINNTYDNFSDKIKEILQTEENLESLKIYTLETEITSLWNTSSITKNITNIMTNLNNKNITPKNYTFIITDKNDITKSVKIINLTIDNIEKNNLSIIINDIINNKQTSILTENQITYEYIN